MADKYKIILDPTIPGLMQKVNGEMSITSIQDPQWRPLGNPDHDGTNYFQAMTLFY